MNAYKTFFYLTLVIALTLVFPWVLQDGMFCDGILYSNVSKNFAAGYGSFWNLPGNCEGINSFHEQPPLVFFLQSLFFRLIPESIYPERIYCLIMLILSIYLIRGIWTHYFINDPISKATFLSVLYYVVCPTVFWAYTNNVIEISMVNFVLGAVFLMIRFFRENKSSWFLFFAGMMILGASLCKGVQGTFAITVPAIYWFVHRKHSFKEMLFQSMLTLLPMILFYLVAIQFESVKQSYELYFNGRYTATFAGKHDTVPFRLYLFWDLFQILIPTLLISLPFIIFGRVKISSHRKKDAAFFIVIAACGILPLMVTKEQRTFYMLTGLPFLMVGLASLSGDSIVYWLNKLSLNSIRIVNIISSVLLAVVIVFSLSIAGTPKRDSNLLHDVYAAGKLIGKDEVVGCNSTIYNDWAVPNYFNRYFHICLVTDELASGRKWFVVRLHEQLPDGYVDTNVNNKYFKLGKKAT